jgi:uncharacterized protein involved in response to NO
MSSLTTEASPMPMPALLTVAFRPFFLLAGLFAALGVPSWLLIRSGDLTFAGPLGGSLWHGHEMIFGFAVAVFAGFLLTAAQNWTGRTTVRGFPLAVLALLWVAGRVLLLVPAGDMPWPGIVVDTLFLPAVAVLLLRPLLLTGNWRNVLFPAGLLVLAALNLAVHLSALGRLDWDPSRILWLALELMATMMVIMGGRVIPFFSRNVLPQAGIATWNPADIAAIAATAAIVPADLFAGEGPILGLVALAAGAANIARMLAWRSWTTRRLPILWVLHLGYLWLPLAFLLRGAGAFEWVPADAALHALGSGAVGTLTLGMMSRVALGHSGRAIVAAPLTALAYILVLLAGVLRVAASFDGDALLHVSAACWILGWLCFLIVYVPICVGRGAQGRAC